jgi:heptosyltransferase I
MLRNRKVVHTDVVGVMVQRRQAIQLLEGDARRVCLIKPSALGDVVQTLPILSVLRERFPQAEISWLVNRELGELLVGHPHLDQIIPFDRRGNWSNWMQLLRDLRRRRFDLVFDLQGLLRTGVMTLATGAALRVGLETAREGAHLACHYTIPDTGRLVPAHLRYWKVAEAVGLGELRRQAVVSFDSEVRLWRRQTLGRVRPPLLAVHPGAQWITKRWPVEKFAAVAGRAMRAYGFSVVILGSRAEQPVAAQLESLLRQERPAGVVRNLCGQTTLKQLGACLAEADLVLTNDSGPMHLAAALGTPVVAVFTCTSPQLSGPAGSRHELVVADVPCAASYKKRCPYSGGEHMACLQELAIDRVWQAFVRAMKKNAGTVRAA